MDSYIDIAGLSIMINIYVSNKFSNILVFRKITNTKAWKLWLISLAITNIILIIIVDYIKYYHLIIFLFIFILISLIYKFIIHSFIFLTFFILNNMISVYLSNYLEFKNGLVIVTYPSGLYLSLFVPISSYALLLFFTFIKKRYQTSKYELDIILIVSNNKIKLKGYADSGNTLLIDNYPVIFLSNKYRYLIKELEKGPIIEYKTVSEQTSETSYKGEIIIKDKVFRVLISISQNRSHFHECDCLLNLNLI